MATSPEIQEVLLRTDLVELVGTFVKLSRSGRSFKGLCPFHADKNPSFHVYPGDGLRPCMYRCYACNASGDAIRFLMEKEGISFIEALTQLARKAGVDLSSQIHSHHAKQKNRFDILEQCQSHFRANLKHQTKGEKVRDYLKSRKIPMDLADRFGLGYADDSWDNLVRLFQGDEDSLKLALSQGMIKPRENQSGYYDFFRNRLMFPVHNPNGQIIAFAGRDLSGDSQAKYLNTPETDLFKKGRVLYGLYQAKQEIRTKKRVILVEGYIDVIRMHEYGFGETVAPMGTALTEEQLAILDRLAEELVLLFDGDQAGINAALRNIEQTWNLPCSVTVVHLPEGMDPDDFLLRNSAEAMADLLDAGKDAFAYLMDHACNQFGTNTPEQVNKVVQSIFQSLLKMKSPVQINLRLRNVSARLGILFETLREEWQIYEKKHAKLKSVSSPKTRMPESIGNEEGLPAQLQEAVRGILVLLLSNHESAPESNEIVFCNNSQVRELLQTLLKDLDLYKSQEILKKVIHVFLHEGEIAARNYWESTEKDHFYWEVEGEIREKGVPEEPLKALRDYANTFKTAQIEKQLKDFSLRLFTAEQAQKWEQVGEIAQQIDALVREREVLMSSLREVK